MKRFKRNLILSITLLLLAATAQSAVSVVENHVDVLCYGDSTGIINITAFNGAAPYTYLWNNGSTVEDRSNLTAGTYSVTVTDNLAATSSISITIIEESIFTTVLSAIGISCHSGSNGAINNNPNGGRPPYSYLWNDGAFTKNRNGLTAATYTVTITDLNGCKTVDSIFVPQPAFAVTVVAVPTSLSCLGGATGTVVAHATGGTPPYSYWWGPGQVDSFRNSLVSGTYCVSASDSKGCPANACAAIPSYTALTISSTQINNVCYGDSAGSVNVTAGNSASPYSYLWNIGSTAEDLAILKAGSYQLTVTDTNACTISHSVTITEPAFPISVNTTIADVSCYGLGDGSVTVSPINGVPPYNYNWQNASTLPSRSLLRPGNYLVTITDNNSCTILSSAIVSEPTPITIIPSVIDVACYGDSTGVINLAVNGSFAPYFYYWNDGDNVQNNTNVAAGNDTVLIVDNHGCSASATATVNQPLAPLAVAVVVSDVSCYAGNNGWINLNVTGGTASYSFDWGGGVVSQNRTNLSAGNYSVTVMDNAGCSSISNITVNQPDSILITLVITDVICSGGNNGAINLTVTGGTTPYTFNWGGSVTSQNRTSLAASSYTVTVSDTFSCMATNTAVVASTSPLNVSAIPTSVTCNGLSNGAINITVNGGVAPYSFVWNNGDTTQNKNAITAGNYLVTVTDVNACIGTASVNVTEPAPLVASTTVVNPTCFGLSNGSIDLTVSGGAGGYLYSWSNNLQTEDINNLPDGNYLVNVTDLNSCVVSTSAMVTQPTAISLSTAKTGVGCSSSNSGNIDLTVAGGTLPYNYQWSNAATTQDISSLSVGNYSVAVRDTNLCSASTVVNISQTASAIISETHVDVSCYGTNNGSINISVNGGNAPYNYNWNGSTVGSNPTNLSPGVYAVTVSDVMSCSASVSVTIAEPAVLSLSTTQINIVCNGAATGSIDLSVSGGNSGCNYLWNDSFSNEDRNAVGAGSYSVTVSDAKSCSASASVTLTQSAAIQTTFSNVDVTCFGANTGSIDLTVANGIAPYSFVWTNNSFTEDINNLPAGTYTVLVTDANGCAVVDSTTLLQPAAIQANPIVTDVSCFGGSDGKIDLTVNGGASSYNYRWNNLAVTKDVSLLAANSYSVTITDAAGCAIQVQNIIVTQPLPLNVSSTVVPVSCTDHRNGSIDLNVSGGVSPYSYEWSNQSTTPNIGNLDLGNYAATITDYNGCFTNISENIGITPPLALTSSTRNTACLQVQTGAVDLIVNGGTPSYTFNWSDGNTTEDLNNISDGIYAVTVTDSRDCSAKADVEVLFDYNLELDAAAPSASVNSGETLLLSAVSNLDHGNIYSWSTPYNLICSSCYQVEVTPQQTTTYIVTVIDENGCETSDSVAVEVNSANDIFIPNVFTPNNDGSNDVFELRGDLGNIHFLNFSVFNRWGEHVFETSDHHFKWDGVYKGEILQQGAYIYTMKVVFSNGNSRDLTGSITILR